MLGGVDERFGLFGRWLGLTGLATAAALATHAPAGAAPPSSAVFCSAKAGPAVLAVAPAGDGSLRFGVSVWSPGGGNASVVGVAAPTGGGWRYSEAGGRCTIDLAADGAGGFAVRAEPAADCHAHGGQGAAIGTLRFTKADDEGPVGDELLGAEQFQHAGRCAGGARPR